MKKRVAIVTGLGVALLSAVYVMQVQAAEKKVVTEMEKIAKAINSGKDAKAVKEMGAGLAKGAADQDVYLVMEVFSKRKPNGKGGVGLGSTPGKISPDGIEAKLINMKRRVTAADLADADALQKAADLMAAGAAATYHLAPEKVKKAKAKLTKWQKLADDMYTNAVALSKALKAKDKTAAKAAASKLEASCVGCHNDYR